MTSLLSYFANPAKLRKLGIVGLNERNGRYLLPNNPRHLYRAVDDKLRTKELAIAAEIAVPELYGVLRSPGDLRKIESLVSERSSFVMKPAMGSGGKGVLVIKEKKEERFLKGSGSSLSLEELKFHASNILGGLFSLGGKRDAVMLEEFVSCEAGLQSYSFQGAPDIRVVMLHGYPVMAMMRLATRASDGRANLHQGAVGVGIDLGTGRTTHAICGRESVAKHPDLGVALIGQLIPHWGEVLELASRCYDFANLGYLGADVMVCEDLGPTLIEVNARPGLAIQSANGAGLQDRFERVQREADRLKGQAVLEERVDFAMQEFTAG